MAGKILKTINIKGKPYVLIKERVKAFRELYPNYALTSEIVQIDGKRVTFRACVYDPDGRLIATGHASEVEGSTTINTSSHIENCETSSWGRCLANMGIGIDESIASADEVLNAKEQQVKALMDSLPTEEDKTPTADDFKETLENMSDRPTEKEIHDKIKDDKKRYFKKKRIFDLMERAEILPETFLKTMEINDIDDLTDEKMDEAIERLQAKIKKNESAGDK